MLSNVEIAQLIVAIKETIYMSLISLSFSAIIGVVTGIVLYCTQSNGLYENKIVNKIADTLINTLRAIPFIILMIILIPVSKFFTGSMLGATAALPSLIVAASPFYARLCVIALLEVDKGVIEASKAMGATKLDIIIKVLIPESLPALISGLSVTGISLVSYTAMAGALGSGGLGNLAYMYGFARRNNVILYGATILVILLVFLIQAIGDYCVKRIDKR
ncbi:MAG: methionine ABC transporter permease [Anaerorhabdus sp.]